MPYLRNPTGRIVAVDDQEQYETLLNSGYTGISKEEERTYVAERFAMVKAMTPSDEDPNKINVYLATVTQGGKDGYGVASKHLISELRELDINIDTFYKSQKIGLLFHNPYSITHMRNPVRLIYTMFESDKLPDDWPDYLREADEVIVPSKWCRDVFARSGIQARVVPLGYNSTLFTPIKRTNKRKSREPFVFLHYNAFNARKGFLELFKAFTQEFDRAEPVQLVLKTTLKYIPSAFPVNPQQYPNIKIITGSTGDTELRDLLYQADCFVFPSRGEGFGMPPIEAMATGLPVIVPNAHGISEYFDRQYMYEVQIKEMAPAIYSRYKNQDVGKMVVCDVDHLRAQMRYVYEHQDEAIEKGKLASEYVKRYTWAKSAGKLKEILSEYHIKAVADKGLRNALALEKV